MRQIVFDTETTGMNKGTPYNGEINVATGHRIIEIGCVELINRLPTENYFHYYIQPQRDIEVEAVGVHGITNEFLADKPTFSDIASELWAYLDGANELIAHNMAFDQAFIDEELRLLGEKKLLAQRYHLVDSLAIAKQKHIGQSNSLDALCRRYNIDNTNRDLHGALLDAKLLAEVYLRMTGGQTDLILDAGKQPASTIHNTNNAISNNVTHIQQHWLSVNVSDDERAEHQRILNSITIDDD